MTDADPSTVFRLSAASVTGRSWSAQSPAATKSFCACASVSWRIAEKPSSGFAPSLLDRAGVGGLQDEQVAEDDLRQGDTVSDLERADEVDVVALLEGAHQSWCSLPASSKARSRPLSWALIPCSPSGRKRLSVTCSPS